MDMSSMFQLCLSLKVLDVGGFKTGNVTSMSYMFYACKSLTTVYASDISATKGLSNRKKISWYVLFLAE